MPPRVMLRQTMLYLGATSPLRALAAQTHLGAYRLHAVLGAGRRSRSYLAEGPKPGWVLLRSFDAFSEASELRQALQDTGGLRLGGSQPEVLAVNDHVFALDELIFGENLATVLTQLHEHQQAMPAEIAASLMLMALDLLLGANRVHGDLMPHHVMIGYDGRLVLIDPAGSKAQERAQHPSRAPYQTGRTGQSGDDLVRLGAMMLDAVLGRPSKLALDQIRSKDQLPSDLPEAMAALFWPLLSAHDLGLSDVPRLSLRLSAGLKTPPSERQSQLSRWMKAGLQEHRTAWQTLLEEAERQGDASVRPSGLRDAAWGECLPEVTQVGFDLPDVSKTPLKPLSEPDPESEEATQIHLKTTEQPPLTAEQPPLTGLPPSSLSEADRNLDVTLEISGRDRPSILREGEDAALQDALFCQFGVGSETDPSEILQDAELKPLLDGQEELFSPLGESRSTGVWADMPWSIAATEQGRTQIKKLGLGDTETPGASEGPETSRDAAFEARDQVETYDDGTPTPLLSQADRDELYQGAISEDVIIEGNFEAHIPTQVVRRRTLSRDLPVRQPSRDLPESARDDDAKGDGAPTELARKAGPSILNLHPKPRPTGDLGPAPPSREVPSSEPHAEASTKREPDRSLARPSERRSESPSDRPPSPVQADPALRAGESPQLHAGEIGSGEPPRPRSKLGLGLGLVFGLLVLLGLLAVLAQAGLLGRGMAELWQRLVSMLGA